jgi:hypothetical protein
MHREGISRLYELPYETIVAATIEKTKKDSRFLIPKSYCKPELYRFFPHIISGEASDAFLSVGISALEIF